MTPAATQVFRLHADQRWGGGEELRPHLAADGRLHAEHVMSDELDDGSFTLILLRGHFAAGLVPTDEGGPGIPLFQWYRALDRFNADGSRTVHLGVGPVESSARPSPDQNESICRVLSVVAAVTGGLEADSSRPSCGIRGAGRTVPASPPSWRPASREGSARIASGRGSACARPPSRPATPVWVRR
jgi:hypothetical protein